MGYMNSKICADLISCKYLICYKVLHGLL